MYVWQSGSFSLYSSSITSAFLMFLFGFNFSPGIISDLLSLCTTCNYLKFRPRLHNNVGRNAKPFFAIPNIRSAHARPVGGDVRRIVRYRLHPCITNASPLISIDAAIPFCWRRDNKCSTVSSTVSSTCCSVVAHSCRCCCSSRTTLSERVMRTRHRLLPVCFLFARRRKR